VVWTVTAPDPFTTLVSILADATNATDAKIKGITVTYTLATDVWTVTGM